MAFRVNNLGNCSKTTPPGSSSSPEGATGATNSKSPAAETSSDDTSKNDTPLGRAAARIGDFATSLANLTLFRLGARTGINSNHRGENALGSTHTGGNGVADAGRRMHAPFVTAPAPRPITLSKLIKINGAAPKENAYNEAYQLIVSVLRSFPRHELDQIAVHMLTRLPGRDDPITPISQSYTPQQILDHRILEPSLYPNGIPDPSSELEFGLCEIALLSRSFFVALHRASAGTLPTLYQERSSELREQLWREALVLELRVSQLMEHVAPLEGGHRVCKEAGDLLRFFGGLASEIHNAEMGFISKLVEHRVFMSSQLPYSDNLFPPSERRKFLAQPLVKALLRASRKPSKFPHRKPEVGTVGDTIPTLDKRLENHLARWPRLMQDESKTRPPWAGA